jgi:hypothetical protein
MTEASGGGSAAAAAPAGGAPGPEPVADERLANIGLVARLMRRPEVGSLLGALVICAFFWLNTDTRTSSARSTGSRTGPTSRRRSESWRSPSRC